MPTLVRPPIPPRSFSGIPYHRMIHEELTEAIRRVVKGVLLGVEAAGGSFPDERVVEIVVRLGDPRIALPTYIWEELAREGADRAKFQLQNRSFDALELSEETLSFVCFFPGRALEGEGVWDLVRLPWESLIFYYDHQAGVILEIPEPLPAEEEGEAQAQEEASGLARRLAEEAFRELDEDDEEPN